jgi:hypothetical protein
MPVPTTAAVDPPKMWLVDNEDRFDLGDLISHVHPLAEITTAVRRMRDLLEVKPASSFQ